MCTYQNEMNDASDSIVLAPPILLEIGSIQATNEGDLDGLIGLSPPKLLTVPPYLLASSHPHPDLPPQCRANAAGSAD